MMPRSLNLMTDTQSAGGMKTLGMLPRQSKAGTLAEVLAKGRLTAPLNGGGLLEGLGRGGEAFFTARGARDEREREDQRQQMLARVLSESGGDRSKMFQSLAQVGDVENAMKVLPPERKPVEVSGGASLAMPGADGSYSTAYTAPQAGPAEGTFKDGMMFLNGQWVQNPDYWKAKRGVAQAGRPQLQLSDDFEVVE